MEHTETMTMKTDDLETSEQATLGEDAKDKPMDTGAGSSSYDASKISLVEQLKRKDSFGMPLSAIPLSGRGRYQPFADDDKILQRPGDGEGTSEFDEKETAGGGVMTDGHRAGSGAPPSTARAYPAPRAPGRPPPTPAETDGNGTAEGSIKRDSLVATVTVVTNLMKWQMRSKMQAGNKLKSMEKYKGHMDVIQRRSRQEQVDIPFPIRLSVKREVLPIIHNIVKEYRQCLGPDHKLTQEALAKEDQLQSELAGEGIFL